jgi:hypothetical protein
MARLKTKVDMSEVSRGLTMHVRVRVRRDRRFRLGMLVLCVAVWLLNMGLVVEGIDPEDTRGTG